jgi:hydroxymethylbilane synthase
VAEQLRAVGVAVELVLITTRGDVQSGPIGGLGGQGVFTKEIQRALLEDRIDLAVHSLKDLPTEPVEGLCLAAVPPRASVADVLVARQPTTFDALPAEARVGTGSLRRRAQLLHARCDLRILDIRGNVDTRLRRLDEGEYDAIVLAEAGLQRLELAHRITEVLSSTWMLPAIGQGALGLETRGDDLVTRRQVASLNDPDTHAAVLAERTLLAQLHGGCLAPIAAWGRVVDGQLELEAAVLDPLGRERLATRVQGAPEAAISLGEQAARELLGQGAEVLIAASRQAPSDP